ncbi:MAG: hypothetical protein J6X89_01440 [Bacteroidales bacterium]|nr:hypothetical protein [Bacteroidales bacterium]
MKKSFIRFAALIMGAIVAFACNKDPQNNPDNPDKDKDNPKDEQVCSVQITIDGDFADWDQITAETAGKDDCLAMLKAAGADEPVQMIKTASDKFNVYFYAEILVEALPQTSICGEWGDSWNGVTGYKGDEDNDRVREVFNLFFDPDGNVNTGFYTYADGEGEPAIPGLGCEQCSQEFFFFNPDTRKLGVAWNQTNIGPKTVKDANGNDVPYDYNGDYFQQDEWNAAGTVPQWGWQNTGNGEGDNIAPKPENLKAATVGTKVRVEFAIEKADLVNLEDTATEFAWGVCYRWTTDYSSDLGPIRAAYSN